LITQAQRGFLFFLMVNQGLMRKLIEKGIEDGTITRDEARMLLQNRR